ncbi:hypothetical protein JRI60_47260 [Archangium violaceum]|uniref:hypothetical protein n=1 Tax=Archangium violaceum TaxID=83451 RepID=UPI0019522052|nr:hypothetical protein [Archangium violaceum]QRN96522.1 hypothetical protein JRI60_47260 [Archangium violaceum]
MDWDVVEQLKRGGLDVRRPEVLQIPIRHHSREQDRVIPLEGEEAPVADYSGRIVTVRLKPISRLWTGTAVPPDMTREPPWQYRPFFLLLETTAAVYCAAMGRPELDSEFDRLYRQLCRWPDGHDDHPLFSYLRAAARLYMSLRAVSQAEFETMIQRLRQSAQHFFTHEGSINYAQVVLYPLAFA